MFCENCGKQNPDGAAFCEHCGTRIAAEAAPVAPAAPVATAAPAKKFTVAGLIEKAKAIHQKNKLIFPIAGAVLVVAIALIIVFSILGKQVSMKNYLNITMEGYDGYGSMSYDFGDVTFGLRACGDKDSKEYKERKDKENFLSYDREDVSKDYRKKLEDAQDLVDSIEITCEFPEGKASGSLANGDVITFTIKYDEDVAEDLGLTIKDTTFKYTVEGLKPVAKFDVMSCFDLKAEGYDGYGIVELVCNKTASEKVGDMTFEMEAGENRIYCTDGDGYTSSLWVYLDGDASDKLNGDTVKGKLETSADIFIHDGVELVGLEKEYTVSGLKETEKVDLLQYYKVEFTGLDGSGRPVATPTDEVVTIGDYEVNLQTGDWYKGDKKVAYTSVYFSDGYGLTNGDKIKVFVSFSEYTFSELGIKFINPEQEITVSNLATYVTDLEQIKDYAKATESAKEDLTAYLNRSWGWAVHRDFSSYSDKVIGEDMKLYKAVLATPTNENSYYKNYLYLIFSVSLSDNKLTTPTVYYIPICINNASVYGDGALNGDVSFVNHVGYTDYDEMLRTEFDDGFRANMTIKESEQF